ASEREAAATRSDTASSQHDELQRVARELDEARAQISAMSESQTAASAELARATQDAFAAKERADAAEQRAAELAQSLAERPREPAAAKGAQAGEQPGGIDVAEEIASLQRQLAAQSKAHTKAYNDLRANADQWVTYAKDIKQRLEQANEKILFIDARSTGEVALLRRLSFELERLKPDHELVFREAQKKLIGATMAQQLAQKGYSYDPATAVMSKAEG
ncbi:MAG TPA: chromosome partitioning protein ParA, partial [Paraburkholderia sp.]|nr:chromosome partitioning protein ParA [Paraburkholderia sp.]